MKRLAALFLIFLALFGLFACKEQDPPVVEVYYNVEFSTTFLPYAAAVPAALSVKAGERATEPTLDAEHTPGYVVIWTSDLTARTPYDFASPVTEDLLLYAVETPRTYRVTYLLDRGVNSSKNPTSFTKADQTLTLYAPRLNTDGEDYGYVFRKWSYYDDPTSVVTEIPQGTENDVILRAVIEPITYTVYYKDAGSDFDGKRSYVFGETMILDTPSGAGFLGWTIYMDARKTPVTELTADFVKAHREALFYGNGSGIGLQANWREE